MKEKYLVINAGSSSLKFSMYEMPGAVEIVSGLVERIAEGNSSYTLKYDGKKKETKKEIENHTEAVNIMLKELLENKFINSVDEIKGVGHRTVHGAEKYTKSVIIDEELINDMIEFTKYAPLHHPGNLSGIMAMQKVLPNIPQVAVFDTAFHHSIPEENYMYAVPHEWYLENGVRKYGFHGTSHRYITEVMKEKLNKEAVNLIICHLGSGGSISCIKDGVSYDTTMGLTPLDGIVMCTRSGAIDPSIIEYICKEKSLPLEEVMNNLNKNSGLKGICGKNDFRDVEALANAGDKKAILATKVFRNSVIKYIAQYYFELKGNVDAIIFSAGIGENTSSIREDIINNISDVMDIKLNKELNDNIARFKKYQTGTISTDDSKVKVLVIPTDEEYMILTDTYKITKQMEENNKTLRIKR